MPNFGRRKEANIDRTTVFIIKLYFKFRMPFRFCSKELETRHSQENAIMQRNYDAERFICIMKLVSVT